MIDFKRVIRSVYYFFRCDIPYGVRNLIRWFFIIWRDRDWDPVYIYDILGKKLEFQSEHIRSQDRHTTAQEDADRMDRCVELIGRLREQSCFDEEMTAHEDRWGMHTVDDTGLFCLPFIRENVKTPEDERLESNDLDGAMEIAEERHRREKRELFDTMCEHIEEWWD